MKFGVIVGNPKAQSRTLEAATRIAERLAGRPPDFRVDLAEFGPALLEPAQAQVHRAVSQACDMDVLIVASPTYKATYTGLLKVFLDLFPPEALRDTVALPVMLGGGPHHALAAELLLKPVLVELGAICPVRGLFVLEADYDRLKTVEPWLAAADRILRVAESAILGEGVAGTR